MKRFILVLAVAALMAVMMVAMATPAFAGPKGGSNYGGGGGGTGGSGGKATHNPHKTPTGVVDTDGDLIPDSADNCPTVANPDQADTDLDGTGNACSANGQ
jgi:hypothetical protein